MGKLANKTERDIEALLEVRQLLEKGWCKGAFARDLHGTPVPALSESACQWCLSGAVERACSRRTLSALPGVLNKGLYPEYPELVDVPAVRRVFSALAGVLNKGSRYYHELPAPFNDAQDSVEPVLELVDKTIERLEKEVAA